MTKVTITEQIRRHLRKGYLSDQHIADIMRIKVTRVQQIRWLMNHPNYNRDKMREYRGYRGRNVG